MREASVGFHCPDDVAIARKTQRPVRTSVGAVLRDSPPYVTVAIVVLNVAAFVATVLGASVSHPENSRLFRDWQLEPLFVNRDGTYYQLLTSAFLHASLLHIGANMLAVVFVGPLLEQAIGRWRFAAVYLLSALGGSAAIYAFGSPLVAVIGASGAVFGLFGMCLVMVRRLNLDLQYLVGVIVINFVFTFSVPGISKLAHVGGFITGALAGVVIAGWPTMRTRVPARVQAAGLGGLLVLIVVVVVLRSATGDF
jgi:membrane associated rhomboid family serine protease